MSIRVIKSDGIVRNSQLTIIDSITVLSAINIHNFFLVLSIHVEDGMYSKTKYTEILIYN